MQVEDAGAAGAGTQEQVVNPVEVPEQPQPTAEETPQDPKPEVKREPGSVRLKRQQQELQQRIAELEAKLKTPANTPATKGEPNYEEYAAQGKTEGEYWKDYFAHQARQEIQKALSEKETEDKASQFKKERERIVETYQQRANEYAKTVPDFVEVVEDLDVSPAATNAIFESDFGPQIAYHLAQNPDEADKVSAMSYGQVARYLGKLEAKFESNLSKPAGVRTTQAPPPIRPVGTTAKGTMDPYTQNDMSHEAYLEWRAKQ